MLNKGQNLDGYGEDKTSRGPLVAGFVTRQIPRTYLRDIVDSELEFYPFSTPPTLDGGFGDILKSS